MPTNYKTAAHALLSESIADAYLKTAHQLDIACSQLTRLALVEFMQRRGFYAGRLQPITANECNLRKHNRGAPKKLQKGRQLELFAA